MPSFNEISPEQLNRLIGTSAAPNIIDVRIDEDFTANPHLIPTAQRCHHHSITELIPQLLFLKSLKMSGIRFSMST